MGKKQARQCSWVQLLEALRATASRKRSPLSCDPIVLYVTADVFSVLYCRSMVRCLSKQARKRTRISQKPVLSWEGECCVLVNYFLRNNNYFTYGSFYPSLVQVLRWWEWRESERQAKIRAHDSRTRLYCSLEQATFTQAGNMVGLTLISPVCWCVLF